MTDANRRFLEAHDHLRNLGIAIEAQSEGFVRLSLPFDDSLANPGTGVMQGGVVATLLDHAAGAALRTTFDVSDGTVPGHASTDLNISYLRPATDDLTATGEVIRAGGSTAVVRVTVERANGEQVAEGRVTLHIDRENTFGL